MAYIVRRAATVTSIFVSIVSRRRQQSDTVGFVDPWIAGHAYWVAWLATTEGFLECSNHWPQSAESRLNLHSYNRLRVYTLKIPHDFSSFFSLHCCRWRRGLCSLPVNSTQDNIETVFHTSQLEGSCRTLENLMLKMKKIKVKNSSIMTGPSKTNT